MPPPTRSVVGIFTWLLPVVLRTDQRCRVLWCVGGGMPPALHWVYRTLPVLPLVVLLQLVQMLVIHPAFCVAAAGADMAGDGDVLEPAQDQALVAGVLDPQKLGAAAFGAGFGAFHGSVLLHAPDDDEPVTVGAVSRGQTAFRLAPAAVLGDADVAGDGRAQLLEPLPAQEAAQGGLTCFAGIPCDGSGALQLAGGHGLAAPGAGDSAHALHLLQFGQHLLGSSDGLHADPGGEHDPQHLVDAVLGPGDGLVVVLENVRDGGIPAVLAADVPRPGSQPQEHEVEHGIIDQVVALVVQLAVDIGQKGAYLLHGHGSAEHVDGHDAAELAAGIALVHRTRQEAPLDPVLDVVGLHAGNGSKLAADHAAAQKHALDLPDGCLHLCTGTPDRRSRNRPFHLLHLHMFDVT